jgi:hypothetical protein
MTYFEQHQADMTTAEKRPYEAPTLVELGTIADMTQAAPGASTDGIALPTAASQPKRSGARHSALRASG